MDFFRCQSELHGVPALKRGVTGHRTADAILTTFVHELAKLETTSFFVIRDIQITLALKTMIPIAAAVPSALLFRNGFDGLGHLSLPRPVLGADLFESVQQLIWRQKVASEPLGAYCHEYPLWLIVGMRHLSGCITDAERNGAWSVSDAIQPRGSRNAGRTRLWNVLTRAEGVAPWPS